MLLASTLSNPRAPPPSGNQRDMLRAIRYAPASPRRTKRATSSAKNATPCPRRVIAATRERYAEPRRAPMRSPIARLGFQDGMQVTSPTTNPTLGEMFNSMAMRGPATEMQPYRDS